MRLKSIKLAGFKSFVDPTTIPLPSNLTAIVGPNGCGKSNVIDAVRWVLGESSAKHLRGESMADVIFNGSNARKPVAQASVELVFDNREGKLGGAYAAYEEIAVKRQVTRDGQSHYYMNGARCRRKDITDVFLGTGLGARSYAIIEQGMISRLIEAKPDELRVFIEEAAGISKYKERRRETENRMRRTGENLNRLHDVRDELARQLEKLETQAADARLYTQYQEEKRLFKAELTAIRWRRLTRVVARVNQEILDLEAELEGAYAQRIKASTEIESQREVHQELNEKFQTVQTEYYEMGTEIAKIEQTIQHTQERKESLTEEYERAKASVAQSSSHSEEDQARRSEIEAELAELEPELEMLLAQSEETHASMEQAEEALSEWQTAWDDYQNGSAQAREQSQVQQSQIGHLEGSIQRHQEQIIRLEKENKSLSVVEVQAELEQLTEQKESLSTQLKEQEVLLEQVQSNMETQRVTHKEMVAQRDTVTGAIQKNQGKLSSLEALQQAALGVDDEKQNQWLEKVGLGDAQHLVTEMGVEPGWEKAVELVLGPYIQALVNDDVLAGEFAHSLIDAPSSLAVFDAGGGSVVDSAPFALDALAAKVKSKIKNLPGLAFVYCGKNLEEALKYRDTLPPEASIITPEGIWVGRHWLRISKTKNIQEGTLARQEQIQSIEMSLAEDKTQLDQLKAQIEQSNDEAVQLERQKETLYQKINEFNQGLGDVNAQIGAKKVRFEQTSMRIERVKEEYQTQLENQNSDQEKLAEARLLLEEAINQMAEHETEKEQLQSEKEQRKLTFEFARDALNESKDRLHHLKAEINARQSEKQSLDTRILRAEEQYEKASEILKNTESHLLELEDLPEKREELNTKLEERLATEATWLKLREQVQALEHELRELETMRQEAESKAENLRNQLEQKRIKKQTEKVQLDAQQKESEELEIDLEALAEQVEENATESAWEQKIKAKQGRIDGLGAINLAAVDEFESQSKRKGYLDEQFEDLTTALETLVQAIEKIDKETRDRFKDTFDKVNQGLQAHFPEVFGGGSAYLELTGDDLLDTGVTIMARPPGKRNSTIHLLSGGEKALTAIALVFSIFQLNPAPFCMLDEVDAPLDDANVGRYSKMVEKMSKTLQFIYISHNKVAMEMADQLMGVTMHEPGVSRIVSVDVEEAVGMAV